MWLCLQMNKFTKSCVCYVCGESFPYLALVSQVARRPTYKGSVSGLTCLPVDSCTCLGLIVILATLLPTATFGADAIAECCNVLQALEAFFPSDGCLQLLPHAEVFRVVIQGHSLPVSSIKAALHELGVGWARLLGFICQLRFQLTEAT